MKNIKTVFFFVLVSFHLASCAQSKNAIRKLYATFIVHIPGNIPVDREGNQIPQRDTVIMVYAETIPSTINWGSAWMNGTTYSILPSRIDSNYFDAGTLQGTNERMIIKKSSVTSKLWRLQLVQAEKKIICPVKSLPAEIIISAKWRGKKIIQRIKSMKEINGIPTP